MLIDVLNKNQYESFVITGGEPLLNWERTSYIINQIQQNMFNNKHAPMGEIFLYTSLVIDEMADVLAKVDGITFSLHNPLTDEEVSEFKKLQTLVEFFDNKSCYLNIESYINQELPINPSVWDRIQTFVPQSNCPVPEGEDLFRLMEVF
jgi:organic radical activating enzyme